MQQEAELLREMDRQRKQAERVLLEEGAAERRRYATFEGLLRDRQRQDATQALAESAQIALDTQRLFAHRYDAQQEQQKAVMANYL